jgi:hypothetical protein
MSSKLARDSKVKLLTGKYKGKEGWLGCIVEPHHLSSCKIRWEVYHQTGLGWRTLLVNEDNLQPVVTELL